jgi:hypothetical protein
MSLGGVGVGLTLAWPGRQAPNADPAPLDVFNVGPNRTAAFPRVVRGDRNHSAVGLPDPRKGGNEVRSCTNPEV